MDGGSCVAMDECKDDILNCRSKKTIEMNGVYLWGGNKVRLFENT